MTGPVHLRPAQSLETLENKYIANNLGAICIETNTGISTLLHVNEKKIFRIRPE